MSPLEEIPHLRLGTAEFEPFPRMRGTKNIFYRSADGHRIAASFTEFGQYDVTMPFDEFAYVVSGRAIVTLPNGKRYVFEAGDAFYLEAGMELHFDLSPDFQDVAFLISDSKIENL